jgi:hypothetical protein
MMATVSVIKNGLSTQKRKRDIDSTILNSFWDLADVSDVKRLKGADQILNILASKQHDVQVVLYVICL